MDLINFDNVEQEVIIPFRNEQPIILDVKYLVHKNEKYNVSKLTSLEMERLVKGGCTFAFQTCVVCYQRGKFYLLPLTHPVQTIIEKYRKDIGYLRVKCYKKTVKGKRENAYFVLSSFRGKLDDSILNKLDVTELNNNIRRRNV